MTLLKFFFVKRFLQTLASGEKTYYHSLKFYELVFLISVNKNVCGNFFSLFCCVDVNKIQKNNKKICTHLFRCIVTESMCQISEKNKPCIGATSIFHFFKQKAHFPQNNKSLPGTIFSIFHYGTSAIKQ